MDTNSPPLADRLAIQYQGLADQIALAMRDLPPVECSSDGEVLLIGEKMKPLLGVAKIAEMHRKAEKDTYLQAGRTVDTFFAGLLVRLDTTAKAFRAVVDAYQDRKRAEARLAEKREQEAAKAFGDAPPPPVAAKETVRVVAPSGAVSVAGTVKWEFEITDFDAMPRELLMVNEAAVRAKIAGLKATVKDIDKAAIPGLRLFEKVQSRFT